MLQVGTLQPELASPTLMKEVDAQFAVCRGLGKGIQHVGMVAARVQEVELRHSTSVLLSRLHESARRASRDLLLHLHFILASFQGARICSHTLIVSTDRFLSETIGASRQKWWTMDEVLVALCQTDVV